MRRRKLPRGWRQSQTQVIQYPQLTFAAHHQSVCDPEVGLQPVLPLCLLIHWHHSEDLSPLMMILMLHGQGDRHLLIGVVKLILGLGVYCLTMRYDYRTVCDMMQTMIWLLCGSDGRVKMGGRVKMAACIVILLFRVVSVLLVYLVSLLLIVSYQNLDDLMSNGLSMLALLHIIGLMVYASENQYKLEMTQISKILCELRGWILYVYVCVALSIPTICTVLLVIFSDRVISGSHGVAFRLIG